MSGRPRPLRVAVGSQLSVLIGSSDFSHFGERLCLGRLSEFVSLWRASLSASAPDPPRSSVVRAGPWALAKHANEAQEVGEPRYERAELNFVRRPRLLVCHASTL